MCVQCIGGIWTVCACVHWRHLTEIGNGDKWLWPCGHSTDTWWIDLFKSFYWKGLSIHCNAAAFANNLLGMCLNFICRCNSFWYLWFLSCSNLDGIRSERKKERKYWNWYNSDIFHQTTKISNLYYIECIKIYCYSGDFGITREKKWLLQIGYIAQTKENDFV